MLGMFQSTLAYARIKARCTSDCRFVRADVFFNRVGSARYRAVAEGSVLLKRFQVYLRQTAGLYRGISYRCSEQSIFHPRLNKSAGRRPPSYHYLIEISVPLKFVGCLEIIPRAAISSLFDTITRDALRSDQRVQTGDPQFDQVFSVHADKGASVSQLLSPAVRQILVAIAKENQSPKLKAGFRNGWFHLEFPIPEESFSSLSLLRPMPELISSTQRICWQLTLHSA
ncbi:hypothetical protein DEA98_26660 [Brucella pseudogrignonensis]|nr:hypothetical protein [Brucella pseudogrignonensis]